MLRYHKFTIGHAWISEYGSPDDNDNGEKHYRNLISYSPLHTIPTMVDHYPATLLLTGNFCFVFFVIFELNVDNF